MVTVDERARHAVSGLKAAVESAELRLFKVPAVRVVRPAWMTAAAGAAAGLAVLIVLTIGDGIQAPEVGSPATAVPATTAPEPTPTSAFADPPKSPSTTGQAIPTTTTTEPVPTTTAATTTTAAPTTTTVPATTTTTIGEVEFSANATWLESSVLPPYDEYYGTATPGTSVAVISDYGSGETVAGADGKWYLKVEFPEAPFGVTFEVAVRHQGGATFGFPFTNRAG
jgi:hypothetical protein